MSAKKRYSISYDEMQKNQKLEEFNIDEGVDIAVNTPPKAVMSPTGHPSKVDDKTVLFFNRCEIRRPYFDNGRKPTTTDNKTWNVGLFAVFNDRAGKEYVWMPRWKDVESIQDNKDVVEGKNK